MAGFLVGGGCRPIWIRCELVYQSVVMLHKYRSETEYKSPTWKHIVQAEWRQVSSLGFRSAHLKLISFKPLRDIYNSQMCL